MSVTAALGVTPRQGMIASQVTASAMASTTTATRLLKAVFDWGDGSAPTTVDDLVVVSPARGNQASPRTPIATHTYDSAKPKNAGGGQYWQYTVSVTVTDTSGATATATAVVTLRAMTWDTIIPTTVSDIAAALNSAFSAGGGVGGDGLTGRRILIQGATTRVASGTIAPRNGSVIWGEQTTGSWDPATGHVTLANYPIIDGNWSVARGVANQNEANDVTIHGVAFRGYTAGIAGSGANASNQADAHAAESEMAVWGWGDNGNGQHWLGEYMDVGPNRGSGLRLSGQYAVAQFCKVHNNDCEGIGGGTFAVNQFCEVNNNNPRGFFDGVDVGGGGKISHCHHHVVRFTRYEANQDYGPWVDGVIYGMVWEDNWILQNAQSSGMFAEVMSGGGGGGGGTDLPGIAGTGMIMRRNICVGNGFSPVDGSRGGAINVSASNGADIYHNIMDGDWNAVIFVTAVRPETLASGSTHDNSVHDNWVRFREPGGLMGYYNGTWANGRQQSISNMVFEGNGYYGNQSGVHFALFNPGATSQGVAFAAWQAGNGANPGGYDHQAVWNQGAFPSTIPLSGGVVPVAPTVVINSVTSITQTSCNVNLVVNPGTAVTTWTLRVLRDLGAQQGQQVVAQTGGTVPANAGPTAIVVPLTGLTPGTTYTLELTATSVVGSPTPFLSRLRQRRPRWYLSPVSKSASPK